MDSFDERLTRILDGYANSWQEKKLALPNHLPHLVHWVREFLLFAQGRFRDCAGDRASLPCGAVASP
jgi:hypothetical protein